MGSHRWIEIHDHHSIEDSASHLQNRGFKLFAAHLSANSIPFYKIDFTKPCTINPGAKTDGICRKPQSWRMSIRSPPMVWQVTSFNVSVAAAIILVEAQRQMAVTGFYGNCRRNDDVYRKPLFARVILS